MKKTLLGSCIIVLLSGVVMIATAQDTDPFKKIKPIQDAYKPLNFGDVKPRGWLLKQVQENLAGFTGHLDSLVPALFAKDDIYGKQRLTRKVKSKDVGALGNEGDWQVQFLWWNSETQSNWWDGYLRSAILAGDQQHLARIKKYVRYILSTQDADGYLGIYDKEMRYKFDNENGELWSKATLLRGLLGWYEYTKDPVVLKTVERAVKNVMDNYKLNASQPFRTVNPNVGGLSHGLVFSDVLENLYRLTRRPAYLDYLVFCYKDFSLQVMNEDAQYKKLLDTTLLLSGHGVHTYEHLRTVAAAYYATGNPLLQIALENFLQKIVQTTSPSGGPVGDEWIGGRKADATKRGYEYCSLQELMHSYNELLIKSGNSSYGDKAELLFFNAAQGARHPRESCITYLNADNAYVLTGSLNGDTTDKKQTRYKYSPVHQDAAVCCVPNAGRIAPYYIQHMWLKAGNNLVAALLGPSALTTIINGKKVVIREETNYPYNTRTSFNIEATDAVFDLKIRKPAWAGKVKVNEVYKEENGFIVIHKNKKGKQSITIEFFPDIKTQQDINGEYYFTYGPLVLAHAIDGKEARTKSFPLAGFSDLEYTPENLVVYQYIPGQLIKKEGSQISFEAKLFDPIKKQDEKVLLQPMGQTILRQVTFKKQ